MKLTDVPLFNDLVGSYFVEWPLEFGTIARTIEYFVDREGTACATATLAELDRVLDNCDEADILTLFEKVRYNYDVEPSARGLLTQIRDELEARLEALRA